MPGLSAETRGRPPQRKDSLAELLVRANHLLNVRFCEQLKEHRLSPTEWRVLAVLHEHDGAQMTELARRLLFSPSRMTKVVDRMQRARLVQRRRRVRAQDRRLALVFLTERARRLAAPLMRRVHEHDDVLGSVLGSAAKRQVKAALTRLVDGLTRLARAETHRAAPRHRRLRGRSQDPSRRRGS
jgi:DNA-binding MarR family transcriptional regulator